MDLVPTIYHEKQEPGSMLCAQHALNNLLQSSLFTPQDLADIARQLDILEAEQLDEVPGGAEVEESPNYDDSGFFSIMVMEEALKVLGLKLVRWQSKEMKDAHDTPERMEGFVLNHQLHWYTIRRFATPQRFYNLDSCIPSPTWISPTFLGLTLREAENQGYSIFVVLPTEESAISGLPSSDAADRAATLPPPSTTMRTSDGSAARFSGVGHTLGSSSQDKGKLKRGADFEEMDDGGSGSSVEGESEKRRRRPRWETGSPGEELSEEEQIAQAIAMSLAASRAQEESDDDVVIVEPKDAKGKGKGKSEKKEKKNKKEKEEKPTKMKLERRGEEDEDAELAAAMKASLEVADSKPEKEAEEEADSPSVEELRRRRLARFGG